MFVQQNTEKKATMIRLNPVQDDNNCVKRGLFLVDNDLYNKMTQENFRKILLFDATTEEEKIRWQHILRLKNSGMNY
jgi:hypothetical protein